MYLTTKYVNEQTIFINIAKFYNYVKDYISLLK